MPKTKAYNIYGRTFHLLSENDDSCVKAVVEKLNDEMHTVAKASRGRSYMDVLLLAALNMTEALLLKDKEINMLEDVIDNGGFGDGPDNYHMNGD